MEKLLLTTKEMHEITGLSLDKCYALMHSSQFPSFKLGGRYYVEEEQLRNWLRKQTK